MAQSFQWLGGISAVVLLMAILAIYSLNVLESDREREGTLEELVSAAKIPVEIGDYAGAFKLLDQALVINPASRSTRDAQLTVAMRQIREQTALNDEEANGISEPLLAVLRRGTVHSNATMRADALAHMGWATRLVKSKDPLIKIYFERALRVDPGNVFAHSMWATWCLQVHTGYSMDDWRPCGKVWETARTHYDSAFKSDRHSDYVKSISLLTLAGSHVLSGWSEELTVELIRILNRLRKKNETIPSEVEEQSFGRLRKMLLQHYKDLAQLVDREIATTDVLLTFEWLLAKQNESTRSKGSSLFALAMLNELAGNGKEALAQFRTLRMKVRNVKSFVYPMQYPDAIPYIDKTIASHLELRRGSLGVSSSVLVTEDTAQRLALDEVAGLLVEKTKSGGPAERAGIEAGDIILKINGIPIDSKTIESPVISFLAGETADVTVLRMGATRTLKITAVAQETDRRKSDSPANFEALPMEHKILSSLVNRALYQSILVNVRDDLLQIAPLTEELRIGYGISNEVQGAIVIEESDVVLENQIYTLQPGQVITEVSGKKVLAPEDVASFVASARRIGDKLVPFTVVRNGRQSVVEISISATNE